MSITLNQAPPNNPSPGHAPLPSRPEIVREPVRGQAAEVQKPISAWESVYRIGFLRKGFILLVLAVIW